MNSIKNITDVVENKDTDVVVAVDPLMGTAYLDGKTADARFDEVNTELEKKFDEIKTDSPDTPEIKEDSVYTKKLKLDESVDDFKLLDDDSDEDEYLDYDMFYFVYGIVTDSWPRPRNPLGRPIRKFQYIGFDDYVKGRPNVGVPQVSTDTNGDVVVYANNIKDFADVIAVCDYYKIPHEEPKASRSSETHWPFRLTINVPSYSDGNPMMVEDFFADQGLSLEDVIEDHKVSGKSANWGKTYQKEVNKDRESAKKVVHDDAVEEIYQKWKRLAANSSDPLEWFIKSMFDEMSKKTINGEPLKFSKIILKKKFLKEFEDDFEDEVDETPEV